MPPRARLRLNAAARLDRQLEFAGAEALARNALRAERLAREIPRDALVSEAWLVERLTGVRSRDADTTDALVGQAVAMDCAALALRWSERAPLRAADLPGGARALEAAARELGVTVRSLQRWRRQGLAAVRVTFGRSVRSALSGDALAWCRTELAGKRPARTREAGRRERLVAMAASEPHDGASLHALARRVAVRAGASVATVRRALAWGERTGALSKLGRRVPPGARARAAAWRAWRRGAGLAELAQPLGRSASATLRLVRRERRDRLRALRLQVPPLPTFTRADAADTLLAPRAVRQGLPCTPWPDEARAFLKRFPPASPGLERASISDAQRLVALRYLLWRVERDIGQLRGSDPGPELDRLEAWLRWAGRLRIGLVESALPGAIARLQAMRAGPLTGLPPAALRRALVTAVSAAGEAVDKAMLGDRTLERPRLGALAAACVERAVAGVSWMRPGAAGREAEVALPATLRDATAPWLSLVPLRDDLAELAAADPHPDVRLLERRFGWDGMAPALESVGRRTPDPRQTGTRTARALRRLRRQRAER